MSPSSGGGFTSWFDGDVQALKHVGDLILLYFLLYILLYVLLILTSDTTVYVVLHATAGNKLI